MNSSHPSPGEPIDRSAVSEAIRAEARQIGFELVGIAPAGRPERLDHFSNWLDSGFAGQLGCWSADHIEGLTRLADGIKQHDSVAVVQLHHAGIRSPPAIIGEACVGASVSTPFAPAPAPAPPPAGVVSPSSAHASAMASSPSPSPSPPPSPAPPAAAP